MSLRQITAACYLMPGYSDIYVLAPERSTSLVARFLNEFAPEREFSAEEFVVRGPDGQEQFFTSCDAAVEYCSAWRNCSTSLYWRTLSRPPDHVMVFFLADGHLVLGVSTSENEAQSALANLQRFAGQNTCGYITFEAPPPETGSEFRALCSEFQRFRPRKIIAGAVMAVGTIGLACVLFPFWLLVYAMLGVVVAIVAVVLLSKQMAGRTFEVFQFLSAFFRWGATLNAALYICVLVLEPQFGGRLHLLDWLALAAIILPMLLWFSKIRSSLPAAFVLAIVSSWACIFIVQKGFSS